MIEIIGYEEHENQEYQIQELTDLAKRKELDLKCEKITIESWHTWYLTFNRTLTYLEEKGIQQILNADTFEYNHNAFEYRAWWD